MPPKRDTFYCWPGDLLKPDKVFFLHVSEGERLKRLSRRRVDTNEEMQLKEDVEFRQSYVYSLAAKQETAFHGVLLQNNGSLQEYV